MPSLSCLTIVQQMAAALALPQPSTLFGNVDQQSAQLLELLEQEIYDQRTWPDVYVIALKREFSFTTVAADIQPNALPSDFDHFIDNSMWDRTLTRPVIGPISPQLWEAWKARPVLTSVVFGYILRGNDFMCAPNPPAGDDVHYEYISNLSVYDTGDTVPTKMLFTEDTDTCVFDTVVLKSGLRWRFLRAKGLDYAQEYDIWFNQLQRWMSRQGGMPTLSMAGSYQDWLAGPYVPMFNFPGPV